MGRGYPRLVDVTIHELGHVYSLANLVTNKPGSVGMAHVYFSKLDTDPQEERCYPEELYADMLKILTLGERSTIDHYWSRCVGTNESLMEAALAVVRSATSGEVPTWWTDTYDNSGGTPDLEAFWADVKATSSRSKATAVPYQLRNLFGGYCDEANAAASVPYAIVGWVGDGPTRNPWRDSGCVPEAPGDPTAVAVGSGELTVYWAPPAGDGGSPVEGYKVQWKSGSEEYDPSRQAEVTDLANLSYTISDLTSDVEYTVQVLAYNTNGTGAASAEATETATAGSTTLPKVNSVAISSNPGTDQTYAAGDEIQVTVTFSETVTVTGSPQLTLNVGGEDRTAGYERVTGSALVFSYRVDDGERDAEGVSIKSNSISLNGGMIKDSADDHDALLNHRAVAADAGHKVDGVKPKLAATGGAGVNGIVLALTFDEPLHLWLRPEAGDFTVTGGDISRTVTDVGLSGSAVLLILDLAVEHGEEGIRVSYTPGMNPIRDVPGNEAEALSLVPVTNETPDTTVPGVSGLEITSNPGSDATYAVGDEIEATVTFNETVEVEGTPQLRLRVGSRTRTAGYRRGTDTTELVFAYEVADGDEDTDGVSIEAGRIALNGGTIKDEADNPAELAHEALSAQAGHKVDGVRPAFVSAAVDGSSLALTYGEGLDGRSKPASGDFAVQVDGSGRSVTGVAVSGSEVTLTLDSAVTSGQTVTLTYTPGTNPIRDLAQNPAGALANRTVANQTTFSVCDRTTQVRDAIVAKAPVSACGDVTAAHLTEITLLGLALGRISALQAGDFSGLTALETLYLRDNRLSSLPENIFSGLTALEILHLQDNQLSSLPENIFSGLTALEILHLQDNQLSSLPENIFSGLTALKTLHLTNNQLSTLLADLFSGLSALEFLHLERNQLSTLPENGFSGLATLRRLSLEDNQLSSLPTNLFSGLTALDFLYLRGNQLSSLPADLFSGLTGLRILYLSGNQLSSVDANLFSDLSGLRELRLNGNQLSSLPTNLFSGLTELDFLYLRDNQLSSLPADLFSGLTGLRILYLSGNQLSSVDANLFSDLSGLRELRLNGNQLSSLPTNLFSGLTELDFLYLRDNQLSSLPADLFSGLSALAELNLSGNQLSSLPDGIFSGLTSLKRFEISGNSTDPLPITVSLELIGTDQFQATAHTGAPFEMVLPLDVVTGTFDGPGSVTIPQGSIESDVLTVSRIAGTFEAVILDIEALPSLPGGDTGYELVKSDDLPLEVVAGLPKVTIYPAALSVPVGGSNTYAVDLKSQPTTDVTVSVNAPQNSDISVNTTELTFAAGTFDMAQAVTVTADANATAGEVTLSHMVSGGNYQNIPASDVTVTIIEATTANQAPAFTSDSSFEVEENETAVGRVVATDGDAKDYITGYEITGGADQARFAVVSYDIPATQTRDANPGDLTFVKAPDYERPVTAGGANEYVVVVTATSGTGTRKRTVEQTITVPVTDVEEPPGRPSAPTVDLYPSFFGLTLAVRPGRRELVNTGPDINNYNIWYRVKDSGNFIYISLSDPDWTKPDWVVRIEGGFNRGTTYEVQVQAINDEGESEWSPSAEATVPNESPVVAGSIDDVTLPAGGAVEIVFVNDAFDDPDNDGLRYAAASDNEAVAAVQVIDTEVLVDPLAAGTATITVTATDPWSASTSTTFNANVQTPTLSVPTLSISGDDFTIDFTDNFAASETRAYEVRVRHKTPVGPWATGCFTKTETNEGQNISVSETFSESDFFEPGTTYEADYGYVGTECGDSVTGLRSAVAEVTTTGTPSFDIDVTFLGTPPEQKYQTAFEAAATRWEQIITHDIPNHSLDGYQPLPDATPLDNVDDLLIYARIVSIDGEKGTLGYAGPLLWRVPSALPLVSIVTLDLDDLERLSDERLSAVILHEIGHALGFGVHPWEDHNLLQNPSLAPDGFPIIPEPDTHFPGANAIAAFNTAGGTSYTGAKVPVENTEGGPSSQDSHWRESILDNELMTPFLGEEEVAFPFSAITIQSMADIGYRVDDSQADAYTLPSITSQVALAPEDLSTLLICNVTHPVAVPHKPEPIILKSRSTLGNE